MSSELQLPRDTPSSEHRAPTATFENSRITALDRGYPHPAAPNFTVGSILCRGGGGKGGVPRRDS